MFLKKLYTHYEKCGVCDLYKKYLKYLNKYNSVNILNEEKETFLIQKNYSNNDIDNKKNKDKLIDLFDVIYNNENKYFEFP